MPTRMRRASALACGLAAAFLIDIAEARVTAIQIESIEPFAESTAFGATGAYERLKGKFRGELAQHGNQIVFVELVQHLRAGP